MKLKRLFPVFVFGLGLTLALLSLLGGLTTPVTAAPTRRPRQAPGDIITVCLSGGCDYATIQDAVDASTGGEIIKVATGVYTDVQTRNGTVQIVYLTKTVTIRGGFAPDFSSWDPEVYPTVLDAQRQGRVFYIVGDGSPVIEGLRIVNGDAEASGGASYGGGVSAIGGSGPSLTVTLRYNHVISNYATTVSPGGGGYGGGLSFIFSNAILEENLIEHNVTDGSGGGLRLEQTNAWLRDNIIRHNQAVGTNTGAGGGIYLSFASVHMTNTVIADNEVSYGGAGMVVAGAYARMVHTTLARNHGGDGSGIYVVIGVFHNPSTVLMTNTIISNHTVGITVVQGTAWATNTVILDSVLWYGNGQNTGGGGVIAVTHEYTGDPAFTTDGYHIGPGSAAIDAGVDAGVLNDIDGESRPFGSMPDLGADEATCLARVGGVDYTVIQDAIDTATSGQTVQVAEGTCYENLRITKTVTLEGGWNATFSSRHAAPASVSTIDGMGAGRVISITETSGSIAPTVDGFTITGGDATGLEGSGPHGYDVGGGIYGWYANVTIRDCVVQDNVASRSTIGWGGGIGFYGGNVTLEGNVVEKNVAATNSNGYGGGAYFRFGSATVSGNTVEGNIASNSGNGWGGGLHFFFGSAALQGNTVRENVASEQHTGYGGGICLYGHTVSMDGDVVEGNDANVPGNQGYGGGISAIYNSTLTMDGVVVRDNVAHSDPPGLVFGQGGGMYVNDSALTLNNSTVASNTAYSGGGAYLHAGDNAILAGNFFTNNNAIAYGGGVYVQNSQAVTFTANLFTGNSVVGNGGGSYILFSDDITLNANTIISNADTGVSFYGCENALLDNNIIADNEGGVSITGHTTRLRHNTIARNGALGVSVWGYWDGDGTAILTDTILVNHTVGITVTAGNTATLEGTLWGDGAWANTTDWGGAGHITTGTVNMHGITAFVDPDGGDYHIGPGSAAIDAGVDAGVLTDIDDDARPIGLGFDIGADEARLRVYLPLVLRNS